MENGETTKRCAWYLASQPECSATGGGYYSWQRWRINGAVIDIRWDPSVTPPPQRFLFFEGPGGGSNPRKKLDSGPTGEPDPIPGVNEYWLLNGPAIISALIALGSDPKTNPAEGNKFVAFYRSASIGAYPGVANNIFPVKDSNGRTTHLVVFTSGYVYRFTVNWQVVPW